MKTAWEMPQRNNQKYGDLLIFQTSCFCYFHGCTHTFYDILTLWSTMVTICSTWFMGHPLSSYSTLQIFRSKCSSTNIHVPVTLSCPSLHKKSEVFISVFNIKKRCSKLLGSKTSHLSKFFLIPHSQTSLSTVNEWDEYIEKHPFQWKQGL
jgi:hypothetical protein